MAKHTYREATEYADYWGTRVRREREVDDFRREKDELDRSAHEEADEVATAANRSASPSAPHMGAHG